VTEASVSVEQQVVGRIGPGLAVLLGVGLGDGEAEAAWLVEKVLNLRVFCDEAGQMNRSLLETRGALLFVSQFTLYGDARRGRRPSYTGAAPPDEANRLYEHTVSLARAAGVEVATGVFRATMEVLLVNHGPVTILLDSRRQF
jgi:D-tyrosyl-tRNA(Tyr) deacylase